LDFLVLLLQHRQLLFLEGGLLPAFRQVGLVLLIVLLEILNRTLMRLINLNPLFLHHRVVQLPQPLILQLQSLVLAGVSQLYF
jgi:hypothetical protein